MAGEISPRRRRGTFNGESCSTEAVLDWGGIAVFGMLGVSDNEDEDEDDREDCIGTGDRGDDGGDDRIDDGGWIPLETVWLGPFRLCVESRRATEGRFRDSLIDEKLRIRLSAAGNGVYALENGMYAAKIAQTTTEKII